VSFATVARIVCERVMALLLAPLRWLTSSIIRLAVVAGILVAAYLLLLKPAIDSGEKTVGRSLHSLEKKASPARLERCLRRADGDLEKMKRCTRLF
jgi:cell division protein ZapA (FtsZ GTPase activity inhibitor)